MEWMLWALFPLGEKHAANILECVLAHESTCVTRCSLSLSTSLQPPVLPTASLFGQVVGDAFALSVVGYGIAISLGRIFALKYGYKVDSNQVGGEGWIQG